MILNYQCIIFIKQARAQSFRISAAWVSFAALNNKYEKEKLNLDVCVQDLPRSVFIQILIPQTQTNCCIPDEILPSHSTEKVLVSSPRALYPLAIHRAHPWD